MASDSITHTGLQDRLLEFVEEDDGSFSATRLAFLLWVIGVLTVWIVDSIRQGTPQELSGEVATILGILMTGKVVQKFAEKPGDDQDGSSSQSDTAPKSEGVDPAHSR